MKETNPTATTPFNSIEEAQAHFDSRASFYNERNIDGILAGLDDDIEIHYGENPVMYSKQEFEPFLRQRLASFTSYQLTKTVRMMQGNAVLTDLDIRWAGDASQGEPRRTRAFEIATFRGKKLIKWELISCPRPANLP